MVLVVDSLDASLRGEDLLTAVLQVARSAAFDFLESSLHHSRKFKRVHVGQGELAIVSREAEATGGDAPLPHICLGSSDATTCVICVMLDVRTHTACCFHADEETNPGGCAALVEALAGMAQPELLLVGGCAGSRGARLRGGHSRAASTLLGWFHTQPRLFSLRLCCLGALNTTAAGLPRATSLAVDLSTGAAAPDPWRDRGPLQAARGAQLWMRGPLTSGGLRSIYDTERARLQLALACGAAPAVSVDSLRALAALADDDLLQCTSTSPDVEPPRFTQGRVGRGRARAAFAGKPASQALGAAAFSQTCGRWWPGFWIREVRRGWRCANLSGAWRGGGGRCVGQRHARA